MLNPHIETTRLTLRPVELTDLDRLHNLWIDRHIRRYLFDDRIVSRDWTETEIIKSGESFEKYNFGLWLVFAKQSDNFIGFCGYRLPDESSEPELLYGIKSNYWCQGLGTEVALAASKYAFANLGFQRVIASVDKPNLASVKVLQKIGMKFDRSVCVNGTEILYFVLKQQDLETF